MVAMINCTLPAKALRLADRLLDHKMAVIFHSDASDLLYAVRLIFQTSTNSSLASCCEDAPEYSDQRWYTFTHTDRSDPQSDNLTTSEEDDDFDISFLNPLPISPLNLSLVKTWYGNSYPSSKRFWNPFVHSLKNCLL